jgi:IclR family acetate operon transcriptional repressor
VSAFEGIHWSSNMVSRSGLIKSIDRAITVLDMLAEAGPNGVPLRILSKRMDVNPSTLHHLLATLKQRRIVEQDSLTKHYRLGIHLVELGHAALQVITLASVAKEYLDEIGQKTGYSVSLLVFHGLLRTHLTDVASNQPLTARGAPLEVSTLHATGSGKLLLAYLPDQELGQYLAQARLERFTAKTITDREELMEDLKRIRAEGMSYDRGEHGPRIWCVAAAVQDATQKVVGCIDLVFPSLGVTDEYVSGLAEILRDSAQRLSAQLREIGLVAS